MKYSKQEVMQFVAEEDVKFIRLAFCDVFGKQKNISILTTELQKAFEHGIAIDGSAIAGFGGNVHSDLLLHPEADTLSILPWRPEHGRVVRMFCHITYPDGRAFENDTRTLLKNAVEAARQQGYAFYFGAEQEFYLFELDENGAPTDKPYDTAGYMDIAPEDKGENIRREICLTLEQMGIFPETSHHEEGPGQNEIDFQYSDPLSAADNIMTLQTIVKTVANRNGLYADFSPKPLADKPGNGFHINISVQPDANTQNLTYMIAGVLARAREMTAFLNPCEASYRRLGVNKAPKYVSWSSENRSQLVRIPAAAAKENRRAELRSPDPAVNPYVAFALLIYAGLEGLAEKKHLPFVADFDVYSAPPEKLADLEQLPAQWEQAKAIAKDSAFIRKVLPASIAQIYCS